MTSLDDARDLFDSHFETTKQIVRSVSNGPPNSFTYPHGIAQTDMMVLGDPSAMAG
jgi:hypothetical protein